MKLVAAEEVGMSEERLARIRPVMQSYVDRHMIAGAITLVARHGKVAHFECIGRMDIEASKAMQPDAIFRIYSLTKTVTSAAIMMLVEQGRLLLAEPLSKYVPAFKKVRVFADGTKTSDHLTDPEREITIRDLLMHTAGLGSGIFTDSPVEDLYREAEFYTSADGLKVPLVELVERLASLPLANQPGARWRYSIAPDVLGYLVGLIANMPFDTFLSESIFKPLGMNDTGFYVPKDKVERFCACYGPSPNGGLTPIDEPSTSQYLNAERPLSGAGGLVSTAADYLRFAQMLLNRGELDGVRLLSRKAVQLMTTNQLPDALLPIRVGTDILPGDGWGLGVVVRINDDSGRLGSTGMYGWGGAAGTSCRIDPLEDLLYLQMWQQVGGIPPNSPIFQNLVYQAVRD